METNTEVPPAEQDTAKTKESPFAILFELETIAANGRRAAFEVLKSILAEHNTKLEQAHFSRFCLHPSPDQYLPELLDVLGVKLSADKLAEDITSGLVMHLTSGNTSLSKGVAAILNEAKSRGVALGALTALPESSAKNVVKKLGLAEWDISLYSAADEIDEVFPRSDSWLKLAKAIGRSPRRCLVFVSHKMSCRSALAAGMNCVAVPDEFTAFQDFGGADKVLDTLEDVPAQELLAELLPEGV
jgi:beta-phosphoglucomutase-like phosphatase (HAD superfamily)